MEQKLIELKEQFCKWYCSNKEIDVLLEEGTINDTCSLCMVEEYIRFIRDEVK